MSKFNMKVRLDQNRKAIMIPQPIIAVEADVYSATNFGTITGMSTVYSVKKTMNSR